MNKPTINKLSLILIALTVIVIDQLTKFSAENILVEGISKPFIPAFLNFLIVKNTGAAFSLFNDSTRILAILSLGVSLILLNWLWRSRLIPFWQGLGIAFLLGGTIGNGLDRWRLGYVTDFLQLVPINFPIFNIADIAINIAIVCFIIDSFRRKINQLYR